MIIYLTKEDEQRIVAAEAASNPRLTTEGTVSSE
jgi:hypothetical protein